MEIKIVAFGIAKDILQNRTMNLTVPEGTSVADLKAKLKMDFPEFQKLVSLSLAVDEEYRTDDFLLNPNQEIVIIPPVAGG